ncbi:STAS-like domain-containing protein [Candidatus Uhrbacteria bacterium]|nr:STAS-like domain-containing protein [Candidatus Uhrbacteria bacterium]
MTSSAKIYHVQALIGSSCWGRHMAIKLRDIILADHPGEVILDFNDVVSMTGAFADELQKAERLLNTKQITLKKEHCSPDVAMMLTIVAQRVRQ